jgi:WD40 repeat protein
MRSSIQQIPVLRSLADLNATVRVSQTTLPIAAAAALYLTAQEVRWANQTLFAVGRWDGSVTLYNYDDKRSPALCIAGALAEQDSGGVRMIAAFGDGRCASSNGPGCINVWRVEDPDTTLIHLTYNGSLGSATAGQYISHADGDYLIVGHDAGYLTTWRVETDGIDLVRVVDLRAKKPVNPWGLQTIYGIAELPGGTDLITAADSGCLCVLDPVAGAVWSRTVYDENAQRGLNDVSSMNGYVVTVNCAVGSTQPNLWLFQLQPDKALKLLDSKILRLDASLPQVFAFCVRISQAADGLIWFAATEEGLLWVGRIIDDQLTVLGNQVVASHYGAALAVNEDLLVVAGDALHVYAIT